MTIREYQHHVGAIGFGKKLPQALYVFRDCEGGGFGAELDQMLAHLVARYEAGPESESAASRQMIRFSLGLEISLKDVDAAVAAVQRAVQALHS